MVDLSEIKAFSQQIVEKFQPEGIILYRQTIDFWHKYSPMDIHKYFAWLYPCAIVFPDPGSMVKLITCPSPAKLTTVLSIACPMAWGASHFLLFWHIIISAQANSRAVAIKIIFSLEILKSGMLPMA
jgi:hypothetical protein